MSKTRCYLAVVGRVVIMAAWGCAALAFVPSAITLRVTAESVTSRSEETDVRARWSELRREIARHDELYFRHGTPEISDFEYDQLKAELRSLEARGAADEDEGGATDVGDDRSGAFATWRHGVPMLSLDKVHSDAELAAFDARVAARLGQRQVTYRVEPKYDGLAVSVTYEAGRLVRVVTRGNGREGDDVTLNARALMPELPTNLGGDGPWPERIEVRGEVFMSWAEFARLSAEREAAGEAGFAHPRNLAVGTLRTRDARDVAGRRLEFVAFGWGSWEGEAAGIETLEDFRRLLRAWGLPAAAAVRLATGRDAVLQATVALQADVAAGAFPTDGVVVKIERVADQIALGMGPSVPRWAVARKFEPERATTRLMGVTWQVGRTGVLTPVAELEPVTLAGTTVARATLHNAAEILRRDLRVGDWVEVAKAGEIIPAIVGVHHGRRGGEETAVVLPVNCPACAVPLDRGPDRVAWYCVSTGCPAQVVRRLLHFASPAALNIRGLGPALVESLVAHGGVQDPAGLYALNEADWVALPGVGPRTAERLVAAIAASRDVARNDGARLLAGLGMPGVGRETARRLAAGFGSLAEMSEADEAALLAAGLGPATAAALVGYLARPDVRENWERLRRHGLGESWARPGDEVTVRRGRLTGETVVVTGRLARWTRSEVAGVLEAAGARVGSSVTSATTLLVVGEDPGVSWARARERGLTVIDEEELVRRLGEP